MELSPEQKLFIEQVVNVFETGRKDGDYAGIATLRDGPNKIRQITYGKSQTTEYGNLGELLKMYVAKGGYYADDFKPYLAKIGVRPLTDDQHFRQLLKDAAIKDTLMHKAQDEFFDEKYFKPAMQRAKDLGFKLPLSALVIYDSFIHSGGVLGFLRNRFSELPPSMGGDEKEWVRQYVGVRHEWLKNHSNPVLPPTIYRTKFFKDQIERGNWGLQSRGMKLQGVTWA